MDVLYLVALLSNILFCSCQSSTMVVNVVEITSTSSYTFLCSVPSSTNLTRWTYLAGPTGTSLMSYQNKTCTVSPPDSFLSDSTMYSYTCNSTVFQVTILHAQSDIYNHILACRDAVQPDGIGSNWIIKILEETCSYCEPTMTFNVQDITEGDNVTFICRLSSDVAYVNWYIIGSTSAAMGEVDGQCTTSPSGYTFLDDTYKYDYTCNKTVYQVTRLNVQRSEHNDMYMCTPAHQSKGSGSNWIIKVKAPVTSVNMAPSNHLVNVKESTPVEFPCKTSTARPAASVYWFRHTNGTYTDYARITENITTTADYNDLSVTTSILRFVPTRLDNNTNIFCKANNSVNTTPVKPYKKRLLNVLYKADDPYIPQGSVYRVIENTSSTLSCTVKGGNPTPALVWSCNNFSSTNQAIINSHGNVTMTLTLTPSRTHEGTCTCTSTQTGFQDTTADVSLVVLYPPSKPILIVYGSSVDGDIFFIEGNSRTIKCTSYSEPLPDKYTWTGPMVAGSIDVQRLLFTNIKKIDTGEYKCSAHNTMIPSYGGPVVGFNNTVVNVIVLYPPSALYFVYGNQSGQNISNKFVDVIQGDTFNIVCKSIDGNPSPTFKWNWQNDNLSVLTVENIQDSETNATCTATNFMQETNRAVVQENISDTVYFNILVRPTIKGCGFYYKNRPTDVFNLVNDKLMIMENESFTLKCSVEGKPTPTVLWNIPQGSMVSSSSITVNNLTREMKGDYVFTANSLLEPSFKDKQNVTVNKTVLVYVLYPPVVLPMNDISKQSWRRLNVVCNFTAGMPETTSIKWTRNIDNREWNTTILNIDSPRKSDTGIYTCTASNVMKQIGDDKSYLGQHNQSFHLDVQYEARITSFAVEGFTTENVTVNENAPVRFICNAESNPTAVMTLSHDSKTLKTKISNSLEYTIANGTCLDAGIYVCYAKNALNGAVNSVDVVPLFVNCHPRAAKDVDVNIKSDTGVTITIVFEVIAYPYPSFKWYQQVNRNWILLKEDTKFSIATSAVQSNLTILGVGVEDYTNYKVIVENLYGQMEQIYTFSPYDIPDPPTNFRYIEGHTTTSSIYIEWEPGYDGGLSQTFYIKYKKSSDLQWNYVQVSDNVKQKMKLSLTGLTEGTQYDIGIFASNIKGNSSESQTLIAFTKDIESVTSSGLLIGGIIGGLIGVAVLVAIFVIILRRNGYINACPSKLAQKKGQDNGINKSTDETIYNNIGNDSEYEMVDQKNETFPYSSLEQQRTPSVVDTRDEVKNEIYENLKVQVL